MEVSYKTSYLRYSMNATLIGFFQQLQHNFLTVMYFAYIIQGKIGSLKRFSVSNALKKIANDHKEFCLDASIWLYLSLYLFQITSMTENLILCLMTLLWIYVFACVKIIKNTENNNINEKFVFFIYSRVWLSLSCNPYPWCCYNISALY